MKRFVLTYFGPRAISAGAGAGLMIKPGVSRNVTHTTARAFARRYPDDTLIVDELTGACLHRGANVPVEAPAPEVDPVVTETPTAPEEVETSEVAEVADETVAEVPEVAEVPDDAAADEVVEAVAEEPAAEEADDFSFGDDEEEVEETEAGATDEEILLIVDQAAPMLAQASRDLALEALRLDTVTADELVKIPGIGKATAKKIMSAFED